MGWDSVKTYVKCAARNKYAAGGAVVSAGSLFLDLSTQDIGNLGDALISIAWWGSYCFTAFTGFGIDTFEMYKRTIKDISATGSISQKTQQDTKNWYCKWKGAYIAAKEHGLEDLLQHEKPSFEKMSEKLIKGVLH